MDVHATKNVSIGIDPYPDIYIYMFINIMYLLYINVCYIKAIEAVDSVDVFLCEYHNTSLGPKKWSQQVLESGLTPFSLKLSGALERSQRHGGLKKIPNFMPFP